MKRLSTSVLALSLTLVALPAGAVTFYNFVRPPAPVEKISVDQFTNSTSQHATEVEPHTSSYGSTIVSVIQEGRFPDGGASDIAFATSVDKGNTWKYGSLPGITKLQSKSNKWDRVSDPAVSYDAKHGVWLAVSLPIAGTTGQVPLVSSSPDGLTWSNPIEVGKNNGDFMDKSWIACDSGPRSKYLGTCYVEFDDASQGDVLMMTTSTDGGKTWSKPINPPGAVGLGAQPVMQQNGTVIVPYLPAGGGAIDAFVSSDGGKSWSKSVQAAPQADHAVGGGLRALGLPTAAIDYLGTAYIVWYDCSFRKNCTANDIVFTTSKDGVHWTKVSRIPIDALTSTADHFIPGVAIEHGTSGSTAHVGVAYYYYPKANCSVSTCSLNLGYISSKDGGATWGRPVTLGTPMKLTWLANTTAGYMAGDYIATTFVGADAHVAASLALVPKSKFDQFLVTNSQVLPDDSVHVSSFGERPYPNAHSDHPVRFVPPDGD